MVPKSRGLSGDLLQQSWAMDDRAARVSQILRDARAKTEHSQESAAHELGVSLKTYGQWERAVRVPNARNRRLLEDFYNLDENVLVPIETPEDLSEALRDDLRRIEAKVDLLLASSVSGSSGPLQALIDPGRLREIADSLEDDLSKEDQHRGQAA